MNFGEMNDEALQHVFNEKYFVYLSARARAQAAIKLNRDDLTDETFDNMVAAAKDLMTVQKEIKRRGLVVEEKDEERRAKPKFTSEQYTVKYLLKNHPNWLGCCSPLELDMLDVLLDHVPCVDQHGLSKLLFEIRCSNESYKVYICSPYAGDTEKNVANARRYCRFAYEHENFPIAPHLFFPQFLNDENPDERSDSLDFGKELINWCNEMWVCGDVISAGMKGEIKYAKERGLTIRYFSESCEELDSTEPSPTIEMPMSCDVVNDLPKVELEEEG